MDSTGAMRPSQQLGAVPGTADAVPGHEGNEPEGSIDGAEFASSGEAEVAPRADDFDAELTDDMLEAIRLADFEARQRAMNYVGDGPMNYVGDYVSNITERDTGDFLSRRGHLCSRPSPGGAV